MNELTRTLVSQIGHMNVAAISGGRVLETPDGIILPVGHGYKVEVDLDRGSDTWTVRRTFTRSGVRKVKGERTYVYAEDVGETAYQASCYHNGEFV